MCSLYNNGWGFVDRCSYTVDFGKMYGDKIIYTIHMSIAMIPVRIDAISTDYTLHFVAAVYPPVISGTTYHPSCIRTGRLPTDGEHLEITICASAKGLNLFFKLGHYELLAVYRGILCS